MSKRSKAPAAHKYRVYAVLVILTALSTALLARAVDLQLLRKDFLQHQGDARYLRDVTIPATRGTITDRNGEPLAVSTPVETVWAHPVELLQQTAELPRLARLLGYDAEVLSRKLAQRQDKEFVYLKRHVAPELADQLRALNLNGVHLMREYRRYYPAGEVVAHVVGFTNIDDQGQEGLELAFDDWLRGRPGSKRVIKDLRGRVIEDVERVREARPGRDLTLSIDRRVQYLAYRELKAAVIEHGARSGSIVLLHVASGEVLAMVNQPAYNPNHRRSEDVTGFRNRALTDFFEPGSVIKPFTIAAALESGRFHPETLIDTTPGTLEVSGHTIRDVRDFGVLDVTSVITKSSNVGATKIALALEPDHHWDVFRRFGFGGVTGSGFPGESPGILPNYRRWRELEHATISYGYGLSVTPLQLAAAFSALANGGRWRAPSFVRGAVNPDQAVIDPALAQQILNMMETVTSAGGTGTRAALAHYRVGGKTGTSRKAGADGYQNRYVAAFAGIAPLSDPQFVIVVAVNDPAGEEYYGGQVAAPLAGRVLAGALRLMNVAPDAAPVMDSEQQRVAGQ